MPLDFRLYDQFPEQLDTPILSLDIRSFAGGMNNKIHPTSLGRDQAVLLQDMILKQGALAEKRAGTQDVMAGVTPTGPYIGLGLWNPPTTPQSERLIASAQNGIYDWDGSGAWRACTGGSFSGNEPVYFVQGTKLMPSFESLGWLFQKDASEVLEYDGTATLSVVSGGASGSTTSVPTGTSALFWIGRLWVACDGTDNGYIRYSEFGKPTTFDTSEGFLVNPSDDVTRIVQWFNTGIIIFQRNSIWALDVDQGNFDSLVFDSTRMELLNDDIGCVAGASVAQSGQEFYFLSRRGVMTLSKTARDQAIGVSNPLSDPIQGTIDRINWSNADRARGVVWDNYYLLAVPVDGASQNNIVIAYDIQEDAWFEISGWPVGAWEKANFPGDKDELFFGTNVSSGTEVWEALVEGEDQDNGSDFVGTIETPRYDFGTTDKKKVYRYLDVFTDTSGGGDMTVYARVDEGEFQAMRDTNGDTLVDISAGQLTVPFNIPASLGGENIQVNRYYLDGLDAAREIQFKFEFSGQGASRLLYFTLDGQGQEVTW